VEPAERPFQLCVETHVHAVAEALTRGGITNLNQQIVDETFKILKQINPYTNFLIGNGQHKHAWCGKRPDSDDGIGYYPSDRKELELPVLSAVLRYQFVLRHVESDHSLAGALTLSIKMDDRRDGKLNSNVDLGTTKSDVNLRNEQIPNLPAALSTFVNEVLTPIFAGTPSVDQKFYQRFFNLAKPFVAKRCTGHGCLNLMLDQNRFSLLVQTMADVLSIKDQREFKGHFVGRCLESRYLAHEVSGGGATFLDGETFELHLRKIKRDGRRQKCP